jgi:hypothetical protein
MSRRECLPECVPGPCTELRAKPDEYLSGEREWQRKRGHFSLSLFSLLDSVDASKLGLHYTEQQRNAEPQDIVDSLDVFPQGNQHATSPIHPQRSQIKGSSRVGDEETLHHLVATTMYLLVHAAGYHNKRIDMGNALCQAALLIPLDRPRLTCLETQLPLSLFFTAVISWFLLELYKPSPS